MSLEVYWQSEIYENPRLWDKIIQFCFLHMCRTLKIENGPPIIEFGTEIMNMFLAWTPEKDSQCLRLKAFANYTVES
jgi:hypothetical protein